MLEKRKAFTLAEVLITLAIIGVVAALTIPTLITKMSQKAAEARTKTIEARLLDGINRYSTLEDGLSQSYETTYDFLIGLSKHYKMAQICKADEITNCVPYSIINYTQDGEDKSVEVSTLTSIGSFISGDAADEYLAPASFITSQGTPVVMAFKKDCVWDSGKAMRDIADSGCIAYMYDENGTRNPNKIGKDWQNHGLTITGTGTSSGGAEIATINGVKIMEKAFFPSTGLTKAQCEAEATAEKQAEYGSGKNITACEYEDDRWAYAMKYCHDKGWHLPTEDESLKIAQGLYKNKTTGEHDLSATGGFSSSTYVIDLDLAGPDSLGLKHANGSDLTESKVGVSLWSSVQSSDTHDAYVRAFNTNTIYWHDDTRGDTYVQVLCVGD